jgi:hypothetical protein
VAFEDRNIAKEPKWRKDLTALTGEIVVPVLLIGGRQIVGLDMERMAAALGLETYRSNLSCEGLNEPPELVDLQRTLPAATQSALTHFVQRLQREMEFNAAKEHAPYRDGQHDAMRFARDALIRILAGEYEPEEMVIDREGKA